MSSPPTQLSISVVTFRPALDVLQQTLESLSTAIAQARAEGVLDATRLEIIDNGTEQPAELAALAAAFDSHLRQGHGNIGYGCGHNLSLLASGYPFHLVLNPDVIVDQDAIVAALGYMHHHSDVVILAPKVRCENGRLQHLCKRYPSVFTLALRGFAPRWLRRIFKAQLNHYELLDLPLESPQKAIPLVSGSFMFCRRAPIAEIGGFSSAFFVYFEDFDLSLRAAEVGKLAYVPQVEVIHFGGNAAGKGWRHQQLFIRGAYTFFQRHGWKWI